MPTAKTIISATFTLALLIFTSACGQEAAPTAIPTPTTPPAQLEADILAEGEPEELAQYWREQADRQTGDPEALYRLGLALAITSPEEAGEVLDQVEAISRDYTAQINRLRAALRRGQAVNDRAYQLTQVGQALASLDEWPLAEAALELAVEEDPEYAEAWAYLGEVRYQTGQDGFDALQTALTLNPDSLAVNIFMGLYWRRSDQPEKALPFMRKATKTDPANLPLLEDLANTLVQAGQVEEAFELVTAAVEAAPEDSDAWNVLARVSILNDLQVREVGIPAARQVVVLAPDEAGPLLLLGQGYMLIGSTQLAERFFTQASAAAPELPEPHYYLGLLYYNLSEFDSAQFHLLEAVRLAQENGDTATEGLAEQLLEKVFP